MSNPISEPGSTRQSAEGIGDDGRLPHTTAKGSSTSLPSIRSLLCKTKKDKVSAENVGNSRPVISRPVGLDKTILAVGPDGQPIVKNKKPVVHRSNRVVGPPYL